MQAFFVSWSLLSCTQTSVATEPASVGPTFWDHWGDGRAEVSAYRLTTPRYGEARQGRVTLVFVTERFTDDQRVKSDGGHVDEYPVLKVNEIRDFQTGIYDYNVMTSTFLRLDGKAPWGEPAKVSMTMQEWCGHVYEHVLPTATSVPWTQHSYFDGEADRLLELGRRPNGVFVDALPALVRGLIEPAPDAKWVGQGLSTLVSGRLRHRPPQWSPLGITVGEATHTKTTPAGSYEVRDVVTEHEGASTTWFIEVASPNRIIGWTSTQGEEAELVGTERLAYWTLNREGDARALSRIGLPEPTFVAP